jgi:putative nucleotidyltransferase with HDIG domain
MAETFKPRSYRRTLYLIFLLLLTTGLVMLALAIPILATLSSPSLQAGQVAPQEILAPAGITFESEVLTEQQRESAARAVPPTYNSPDPSVARRQLESLRAALTFISSVRADAFASEEQKLGDLAVLEQINLDEETARAILTIGEPRWQTIHQEAIVVLEQVMRGAIREDRLEDARRSIPTLVSLSLTEDQADIVTELVSAFITSNSAFSESLTEEARQLARDAVTPVTRSYKSGETVVQRGQIITPAILEALVTMGLAQPQFSWQDLVGAAAVAIVSILLIALYLRRRAALLQDLRGLTVLATLFVIFLLGSRFLINADIFTAYLLPVAAYSMTVAVLFRADLALVTSLPLVFLVSYGLPNAAEMHFYFLFSGYLGVLTLGPARRLTAFFRAGAAVAGSCMIIAVAFRPPLSISDLYTLYPLLGAALLNGIASASLTVILQFSLAQFLGMTTALQLMEISRPDHPLLQLVLRNAPGTYQHSLQVANLAEQAAERIGGDPLLTRVGALYHDIGKVQNPMFFIENQMPGSPNPHDELEPAISAQIIIRHITDGMDLAKQHRLPRRIQDFILEHHGTMITRYQYANALKAVDGDESQVDIEPFSYPGPRPGSRETAILMLADGSEARVRAEQPKDEHNLRRVIDEVIDNRVSSGQLDNTDLTLRDLERLAESFTTTLRGIYHPRIEYPKVEKGVAVSPDTIPVQRPSPRPSDVTTPSQPDSPNP